MARVTTLIINPAAGCAGRLNAQLPEILRLLAAHGYAPEILFTAPTPGSGRDLARQSLHSALVLACGGDGTVHDVLQGLAHTGVPLGVLPLGTANALARNLPLPLDPLAALKCLLTYAPQTIPLGELSSANGSRLFTVLAGCGPDGALVHSLPDALKARLGRTAYYAHAARLFATRRWPAFQVEYLLAGDLTPHTAQAVAVTASRVPDLGGLFAGLTPLASLHRPTLHVHLLRAPASVSLPAWFALARLGLPNPLLSIVEATELRCTPLTATPVYAQADAEPAGTLPCTLRLVPNCLTLLMPQTLDPGLKTQN